MARSQSTPSADMMRVLLLHARNRLLRRIRSEAASAGRGDASRRRSDEGPSTARAAGLGLHEPLADIDLGPVARSCGDDLVDYIDSQSALREHTVEVDAVVDQQCPRPTQQLRRLRRAEGPRLG